MATTPTLDLRGGRLQIVADDDDFTVATFRVPFDPSGGTWEFLWRERPKTGAWGEFTVTASGTENDDPAGTWNITVDLDTTDFGEAARVWCLFRDGVPWISGAFVTEASLERGA